MSPFETYHFIGKSDVVRTIKENTIKKSLSTFLTEQTTMNELEAKFVEQLVKQFKEIVISKPVIDNNARMLQPSYEDNVYIACKKALRPMQKNKKNAKKILAKLAKENKMSLDKLINYATDSDEFQNDSENHLELPRILKNLSKHEFGDGPGRQF
jgi:hypothetical protein